MVDGQLPQGSNERESGLSLVVLVSVHLTTQALVIIGVTSLSEIDCPPDKVKKGKHSF
jgi:hypothetical protein